MMVDIIRKDMVTALKGGNTSRKKVLSSILNALQNAAKEKQADLTADEDNQVLFKMLKQLNETLESCPDSRNDIKEATLAEINIISEYAPKMMSDDDIISTIKSVLDELNIEVPNSTDKGRIMKVLMPKVKGKADGKKVNEILMNLMK